MQARPGGSRVAFGWFTSTVLADNPLGDPATRQLPVILPPGYDPQAARRYPVLYALTGFTGRGLKLLNDNPWQESLLQRLDRLYDNGMPHLIVVLPDCFTRLGGSQYLNSAATGRYEDYLTQEIVPYIDTHYNTTAQAGSRGVFGKSSGGFGSLVLTMRHPDLFGALACHSGDMGFDLCYPPDFPKAAETLRKAGGVEAWLQAFEARPDKGHKDIETLNIVAMAACYSPDSAAPLNIALPFDFETCTLSNSIWARWLDWDPLALIEHEGYVGALRAARLVYLDCGTSDEFNLQFGARRLVRRLQARGIPHQYDEFEGGHFNTAHRYDSSLPRLAAALAQD